MENLVLSSVCNLLMEWLLSTFFSLEIKSFKIERDGRTSFPIGTIHILVSHYLCHQGGFKDIEWYTFLL
jgi:hypothetical protein